MDAAIFLTGGSGRTKIDCHANYSNCDIFAVLIPFQISIKSAVERFSNIE